MHVILKCTTDVQKVSVSNRVLEQESEIGISGEQSGYRQEDGLQGQPY